VIPPGAYRNDVLEIDLIRIVVVLFAAKNTDGSIAVARRVARAEDAAAPCAVQGANWGWKGRRGGRGS